MKDEKWSEGHDDGFSAGLFIGELETESKARVAAFGAIRRAAEYARYKERRAVDWERNGVQDLADNAAFTADAIRRAIRAAIGSDKR